MSIEEKIKNAKEDSWLKDSVSEEEFKKIKESVKTDGDCISRKAVLELYDKYHYSLATKVYEFGEELKKLPTYSANLVKESCVLVKDLVKEDLISRKAVLDCFDGELILHIRTGKTEIQKYLQMVVDRIKELPTIPQVDIQDGDYIPAEDLLNECYDIVIDGERFRVCQEESIIGLAMSKGIKLPQTDYESHESFGWCKGCKEYDTEKHCCHRYSSFIRESLQDNINAVLEDIKAELQTLADDEWNQKVMADKGLELAIEIIENYISRKE